MAGAGGSELDPTALAGRLLELPDSDALEAFLANAGEASPFLRHEVVAALKQRADALARDDQDAAGRAVAVARQVAGQSGEPASIALAAWAEGNVHFFAGEYARAQAAYQAALDYYDGTGHALIRGRLLTNLGAVLTDQGRYAAAQVAFDQARSLLTPLGASHYLAILELNQVSLFWELGQVGGAALEACERGEAIARELGLTVQAARFTVNRALVLQRLGSFRPAAALLAAARSVFQQEGQLSETARADLNLGLLAFCLGRYRRALRHLDDARRGFSRTDKGMDVAVVAWHQALAYSRLNLLAEARAFAEQARAGFAQEERDMAGHVAQVDLLLADVYQRQGETAEALAALRHARDFAQAQQAAVRLGLADLVEAQIRRDLGQPGRALQLARRALAAFDEHNLPLEATQARQMLADSLAALDRGEPAADSYRQVLAVAEEAVLLDLVYQAQCGLAALAEAGGDAAAALHHYGQAMLSAETAAHWLGGSEFSLSFLADKLAAFQHAVLLSLEAGEGAAAFAATERARASAALLLTHAVTEELATPAEEHWRWHYHRAQLAQNPVEAASTDDATTHERRLMEAARGLRGPTTGSMVSAAPDVRAALQPGEALLAYYLAEDEWIGFLMVGNREARPGQAFRWQRGLAPAGKLTCRLRRLRYTLSTASPEADQHLIWFYQTLIEPFAQALASCSRVYVVPHDALFHLPFHALRGHDHYLTERWETVSLPAAGLLCGRRRASSPDGGASRAEPGAGRSQQALLLGYPHPSSAGSQLNTDREVEALRDLLEAAAGWEVTAATGQAATLASFEQHAASCTLLHLAAHGQFRGDNPLLSSLHLADGELTLADVLDMRLPQARLVVLSACDTGQGDLRGGNLFGLSRAFLEAGARALLVSLWPVPDEATRRLMLAFYRHWMAGIGTAAALRQAQREIMAVPGWEHPWWWAGFEVVGC